MTGELMKAAVYHGPRDIRVETIPRPEPAAHEIVVQVGAREIRGSDLHTYRFGMFEELGRLVLVALSEHPGPLDRNILLACNSQVAHGLWPRKSSEGTRDD